MNPTLYYAVMLITEPQKARRILLAEELENWFMDLFDEEFEDILEGTFKDNQYVYMNKIVDKYIEITGVDENNSDEFTRTVLDKAVKTAKEIQDATWNNIVTIPLTKRQDEDTIADFILGGIAIGSALFATDSARKWLSRERANLIALNESNWKWNNEEFFEALGSKKTKTWHTAPDERVRLTHMEVEGKTIPVDELFHVGSSLMLYPLDMSHGASLSEIANCRCSVSYGK